MPYIAPEVITEAKRMDLLTYLREYEPGELVKFSSNTYTTRTHDSCLAAATNGEVFRDDLGEFSRIRRSFLDMPQDVRLKKLAGHLIMAATRPAQKLMICSCTACR